ncbi:hypothetical protein NAT51_01445 [Flavobacterium amniphilum]|uniref:hypothetical protein n=1 Tax=Flavobacterium amniphilum TaxID=1834035 RepID=UPI002029D563|nr:hypothetical protein [Flavobacterium amniphilum]MCL9804170.1 hypothetical protein [Flavobacterium amniphilum]
MKNKVLFALFLIATATVFAQKPQTTYTTVEHYKPKNEKETYDSGQNSERFFHKFDLNTSIIGNTKADDPSTSYNESRPWFTLNGIGFKYGIGAHKDKWVSVSAHTGFDWKANERLVAVPVYGNVSLNPSVSEDMRLILQTGIGHGFAIGRGNMQGLYQRYALGLETDNENTDFSIFVEVSSYRFHLHNVQDTLLFNIGGSLKVF